MAPTHVPVASALDVRWSKSRYSNPSGECVELAVMPDGVSVAMRNSRDPSGPALVFDAETICSFIDAAKDDELDWIYASSRYQQVDGGMYVRGGSGESGPGGIGPFPKCV